MRAEARSDCQHSSENIESLQHKKSFEPSLLATKQSAQLHTHRISEIDEASARIADPNFAARQPHQITCDNETQRLDMRTEEGQQNLEFTHDCNEVKHLTLNEGKRTRKQSTALATGQSGCQAIPRKSDPFVWLRRSSCVWPAAAWSKHRPTLDSHRSSLQQHAHNRKSHQLRMTATRPPNSAETRFE